MRLVIGIVTALWAGAALSAPICDDAAAETMFHCPLDGSSRAVTVCRGGDGVFRYAYGKPGQVPELELVRNRDELHFEPWPGIGRFIWESLTFQNGGYRYQVAYSVDKNTGVEDGFLNVFEPGADEPVVARTCRPGTLENRLDSLGG